MSQTTFDEDENEAEHLTYLTPYTIEKSREHVLRDGKNIWDVPLVHPVSDELLERCLFLVFLERGWCIHRDVVIAWCVPELVLEGVVVATAESCEEVLSVVHGRDTSDVISQRWK